MDLSLGFLFCSIDLYFCLCASTILSSWLWICSRAWSQAGWSLQFHSSFSILLWLFEVFVYFHTNCEIICSNSVRNTVGSLIQFSWVTQSCPTLCDPMNCSRPGLPVHHQLPEFTQTHVHWVSDVIQPSHPLLSLSPPAPNPSQHQGLLQWVSSSHKVDKVLELQLHHQYFRWIIRPDFL